MPVNNLRARQHELRRALRGLEPTAGADYRFHRRYAVAKLRLPRRGIRRENSKLGLLHGRRLRLPAAAHPSAENLNGLPSAPSLGVSSPRLEICMNVNPRVAAAAARDSLERVLGGKL
jgi:hypothetical protein